eukprot:3433285-Rhodomonas_salina.2
MRWLSPALLSAMPACARPSPHHTTPHHTRSLSPALNTCAERERERERDTQTETETCAVDDDADDGGAEALVQPRQAVRPARSSR